MTKLVDELNTGNKPMLSIEITPPDRGQKIDGLFQNLESLMPLNPSFINVTYHQAYKDYEEVNGVIISRPRRKKPGTVGICAAIKNRFNIEPVAHLICGGFNKYETEDALIDLHYLGIRNILALRGDPPPGQAYYRAKKDGYNYASELVQQLNDMNRGQYIDNLDNPSPTDFSIGVAAYPEKHYESPNKTKDMEYLKQKVDQGADYIITQMFFSFEVFRDFVTRAREAGITVPILPGIKPVTNRKQLERIPRTFFVSIPDKLYTALDSARTPKEAFRIGTDYMADLAARLIDFGVPGLHVFTMGRGRATRTMLEKSLGMQVTSDR